MLVNFVFNLQPRQLDSSVVYVVKIFPKLYANGGFFCNRMGVFPKIR